MIYALRGNTIKDIALPLQLLTVEETSQTVTDYYPEPTDAICVRMVSTAYIEPMEVSVEGKYLHWAWTPEVTGTYGIEVRISKADGTHMRSYRKQQFRVYNSNDQMPEDDGTVEFISEYLVLDAVAVVWVKGEPGVGISSIDKTSTEGLVDTYTITFTDSHTTTFTVTNGQDATLNPEQIQQIIDEVIAEIDIPTKTSELTNDSGFITTYTETDPIFTSSPAYSITSSDISGWNGKGTYSKPSGGIPKTDLASAVQTSLGKADTSLQPNDVIDSLSSASTTAALSANQGKVLNESKQNVIDATHKLPYSYISDTPTIPSALSDLTDDSTHRVVTDTEISAWDNKANKVLVNNHGTDDTTYSVTPNTLHIWGTVASLTLTLATPTDATIVNEYMIEFTSGSTATTLSLPSSVEWAESCGSLSVEASKTYQISIVNNIGLWCAV